MMSRFANNDEVIRASRETRAAIMNEIESIIVSSCTCFIFTTFNKHNFVAKRTDIDNNKCYVSGYKAVLNKAIAKKMIKMLGRERAEMKRAVDVNFVFCKLNCPHLICTFLMSNVNVAN